MQRSQAQKQRLLEEKDILEKYFPGRVRWQNARTLDTTVEIVMTSNSDKQYTLRVYVPTDYPNSCPEMVVVSPSLRLRDGRPLTEGPSSLFHTLGKRDGHTIICYTQTWTEDDTLYQVFMKGRLWIEGYEGHLNTGQNMDIFLRHQEGAVPWTRHWAHGFPHEEITTFPRWFRDPEIPRPQETPPPCVLL